MLNSEKGNILILAITAVMILSFISINLLEGTILSSKTSYLGIHKEKSDSYAEHGVSVFFDRIETYFIDKEEAGFILSKTYVDDARNDGELAVEFRDDPVEYTLEEEHILKDYNETDKLETTIYNFNPPIEEEFEPIQYFKDNTPIENLGQIAISGDFNDNFKTLEFFVIAHDIDNSQIKLYSYRPFIDKTRFNLETTISITDLYNLKSVGNKYTELDLEDDVEIQTVYDAGFSNLITYISIGKKSDDKIDIFEYNPYKLNSKLSHIVELDSSSFIKSKLIGFYSPSAMAAEIFILTLEEGNKINVRSYIPIVSKDTFEQLEILTIDEVAKGKIIDFSASVIWSDNLNATNMQIGVITSDDLDEKTVTMYSYYPYVEDAINEISGMNLEKNSTIPFFADFNPTHIDLVSYSDSEQIGTVFTVLVLGDVENKRITTHIGYPEFNTFNKHSEILLNTDESVGRLSVGAVNSDISEVVLINPTSIYEKKRYNIESTFNNIIAKAFDHTENEISRTTYNLDAIFEYIEPENTGERTVTETKVINYNKDEN